MLRTFPIFQLSQHFQSTGPHRVPIKTSAGDSDIAPYKIRNGVSVFGTDGLYVGAPTPPSGLTATVQSATQINLAWSNVSMTGYLLIVRAGAAVTFVPTNETSYGTGAQGSDQVIYVGAGTSYNHTGLTTGTTYYYTLYTYDGSYFYSTAATTSAAPGNLCGGPGDNCYADTGAMTAGTAITPLGKSLQYVDADGAGSGAFMVWKEVGTNKILKPNGLDEWVKKLNLNGIGQTATDFTHDNIGTGSTLIKGRVCPPNVYQDDTNKFTTTNCLYYTPEYAAQTLDCSGTCTNQTTDGQIGMGTWSAHKWFSGNIQTCASKGMRLPTLFETTTTDTSTANRPTADGTPTYAQTNGVPSVTGGTWTASVCTGSSRVYWIWSGAVTYSANRYSYGSAYVACVVW